MNTIVNTKELSTTLKTLASAYSRKNTLPIIDNVLIEAILPDSLRLTVHNFEFAEFAVRRTIRGIEVSEEGSTTVNLAALRNALPTPKLSPTVTIENHGEAQPFILRYTASNIRLESLPASEFPPFHEASDPQSSPCYFDNLADLRKGIAACLPAVSSDMAYSLLTAVHGHKTYLEAADGFQMFRQEIGKAIPDFLVGAKLAKVLMGLTAASGWIESKNGRFYYTDPDGWEASADTAWYGRNYPDLEQVIPLHNQATLVIAPEHLSTWLESLVAISKAQDYQLMRFTIGSALEHAGMVKLETNERTMEVNVPATIDLGSPDVDRHYGFNPRYLINLLTTAGKSGKPITLDFNARTYPIKATNGDGYTGVVMPMLIGDERR